MKRRSKLGISLVEILAVITILTILIVTLALVIGPTARRSAYETRIRSDLHQIIGAIHLYMADNDGGYPNYLASLDKAGVKYPTGISELANYPGALGDTKYLLTYTYGCRIVEKWCSPINRFDPDKNSVVKADFYPRQLPDGPRLYFSGPGIGFSSTKEPVKRYMVLGGFLDGHIGWSPMRDLWEQEYAYYMFDALAKEHNSQKGN